MECRWGILGPLYTPLPWNHPASHFLAGSHLHPVRLPPLRDAIQARPRSAGVFGRARNSNGHTFRHQVQSCSTQPEAPRPSCTGSELSLPIFRSRRFRFRVDKSTSTRLIPSLAIPTMRPGEPTPVKIFASWLSPYDTCAPTTHRQSLKSQPYLTYPRSFMTIVSKSLNISISNGSRFHHVRACFIRRESIRK
jgi:hypothetical protein